MFAATTGLADDVVKRIPIWDALLGHSPALGELNTSPGGAALLLAGGLLILWLGIWWWRRCRRRMHQPLSLNIASHLMKKHD